MSGSAPSPAYVLREHSSSVQAIAVDSTNSMLYSGDAEGQVFVWTLQERRPIHRQRLHPPTAGIICLLLPTQADLISQGRDGCIVVWKLSAHGLPSRVTHIATGIVEQPAATQRLHLSGNDMPATGDLIAYPGVDARSVVLASFQGPSWEQSFHQPEGKMQCGMCMTINLFRKDAAVHAACGYEDGTLAVWGASAPASPLFAARLHQEPIMAVAVDASGDGGICGSADTKVVIFSLDFVACCIARRHVIDMQEPGCGDIAIRADHRIFAVAAWSGKIRLYHRRKHRLLAVLQYHRESATSVAFDAASCFLASSSKDGSIAVWSCFADSG